MDILREKIKKNEFFLLNLKENLLSCTTTKKVEQHKKNIEKTTLQQTITAVMENFPSNAVCQSNINIFMVI